MKIDINCDLGEGFGRYTLGGDDQLMKYISSANIACGFHAGDPTTMEKTVKMALENDVKIGAHPGYPDLQGFGRRAMDMHPEEIRAMVIYQVGALKGFVSAYDGRLHHVKPHGALYNRASQDKLTAKAIVEAVKSVDPNLVLYGPYNSELHKASVFNKLTFHCEAFADRAYDKNGQLVSRAEPGAFIDDVKTCAQRIEKLIQENRIETIEGNFVDMKAQTLCVHGDNDKALQFVKSLVDKLKTLGCEVG